LKKLDNFCQKIISVFGDKVMLGAFVFHVPDHFLMSESKDHIQ